MPDICYLCGVNIESDYSMDHLPPKQFYASSLRSDLNLSKLVTIPAHGTCNRSFERDEEYFTWSMSPLAVGSVAGDALARERADKLSRGRSVPLFQAVRQEFDKNPSGLHLPGGRVIKRFEGARVNRVAWKLVRGLYFHETSAVLPDDTPFTTEIIEPERARELAGTNPLWEKVKAQPSRGSYGGVFEYKYFFGEIDGKKLHSWGMILWDKLMIFVAHHHPKDANADERTV
jgi:hypothetical protein